MGKADVQAAAQRLAARSNELEIAFADPRDVSQLDDKISFLTLTALIEPKLASGMTAPDRPRGLDDASS